MQRILITLLMLSQLTAICQDNDSTKKEVDLNFELSFGQSLTFISYSRQVDLRNNEAVIVPTSNLLFFSQFFPNKRFRVPLFFLVPTETKQFLVNGQLINERSSPTIGTGVDFRLFRFRIDKKTMLDFEIGPLASMLFGTSGQVRFAPIAASRLRIARGESAIMYLGTSYSFGINAWGLFYGTGFLF